MKDMFENGVCYICFQHLFISSVDIHITPTLDRISKISEIHFQIVNPAV
jgi:hypothetical protein